MAEQLGLQQIFRNGCGIDGHKRSAGNRRMLVQRPCHQLLAGTGLPGDQHRDMTLAQSADGTKHVLHGGCLTQHFRLHRSLHIGHLLALAFLDGAPDQLHGLGYVKWLGQILKAPRWNAETALSRSE